MSETSWHQRRAFRWPLNILGVLALFWVVGAVQSRHLMDEESLAPPLELRALDGKRHALKDYRGKRVLLAFWAPWCTVCKLEKDNIARVRRWNEGEAVVLSVALSYDSVDAVRKFANEAGEDERFVLLGNRRVAQDFRIEAFPTHYIIDRDGTVDYAGQGYTTTLGLHWRL